ncbi:HTH domain-containing protein [Haloarcula salina]|uniref:HTH domain-containing protein n=1 Tax=Haloarcula salina TaxID=1429914 RepID=UPI003C6EB7AA
MPLTSAQGERRARLFVRSELPTPSRKRCTAIEREVESLVCQGVIDGVETVEWQKRVPLRGDNSGERELYNEFAAWAREAGVALAPFFDTRLCYSTTTGERRRELVLPVVCLALYENGDLVRVAPFADGGRAESVEECIAAIADGDGLARLESTEASTA